MHTVAAAILDITDPDSTRNESLETVGAVGEDAFAVKKGVP